ncbi:MAG: alpha/beta fold hydrolase [Pseudomonadales bacterium]|nr:alpha/beta hydrolase [Pseudomonadales bacterium]
MGGAETELAIEHDGATLRGTLRLPAGRSGVPLVIMVHGSGPLDRDTNMPGQRLDVFKTIAGCLADIGVASLCYDKRGCAASTGDFLRAGHSDHVQDVVAWVDRMGAELRIDPGRILVLGYSEGCLIAPQVFIQRSRVAGLILLCPFVDRIESILLKQAAQLQKESMQWSGLSGFLQMCMMRIQGMHVEAQRKLIDRVRSSSGDVLRAGLKRMPARWLRELLAIEPRALFAQVTCPVLAIGGGKDLQCEAGDAEAIKSLVCGGSEIHVVPDLSHVLRLEREMPTFARYSELIREPVAPVVLDLIADWLQRLSRLPPAAR